MRSLFDRQRDLIDHLRSPEAFRSGDGTHPDLIISPDRLRRLGEHALLKRSRAAQAVFPRTCNLLGERFAAIFANFANTCPAPNISVWDNAKQFYDYTMAQWAERMPEPAYLHDLLAFEAAIWRARRQPMRQAGTEELSVRDDVLGRLACADDVLRLRLAYDIRPLVSGSNAPVSEPVRRPVCLILRRVRGQRPAKILEVTANVYAVLERLAAAPCSAELVLVDPGMDRATIKDLISQGIVESAL
jgi:hypothetical protein